MITCLSCSHVRLLGVTMSPDLSLEIEKHVSVVSAVCFYHLRQICRVRQSLDMESAATLIHVFETSATPYWPGRQRSQQTSCSMWWTLLCTLLATRLRPIPVLGIGIGSSIVACCSYSNDKLHWLDVTDEYNSSSPCWCTDVFMEQLRCTW